jgi:hypothetical protein
MSTVKVKKMSTDQRIKADKPIEIYENKRAGWVWKVWRHYQKAEKEAINPYARVFCSVKSPFTYDSYDMGDVYISDIKAGGGTLTFKEE